MRRIDLVYLAPGKWQAPPDGLWLHGIFIPGGFTSDLDTVPRIPVFHAWLKGRTVSGAMLHDYLYSISHNRADSDKIFLQAMQLEGVKKRYRIPIYIAVRIFGRFYYPRNKFRLL